MENVPQMNKAYIIRKGVSLDQLKDFINFITNYHGGIIKAVHSDGNSSNTEALMKDCDIALLFLAKGSSSSNFEEEVSLTHSLGLRRAVFTLDENTYPSFTPTGIPSLWKLHCGYVHKATNSNILRAIQGATKFGV